jgi:hypothetical protein
LDTDEATFQLDEDDDFEDVSHLHLESEISFLGGVESPAHPKLNTDRDEDVRPGDIITLQAHSNWRSQPGGELVSQFALEL